MPIAAVANIQVAALQRLLSMSLPRLAATAVVPVPALEPTAAPPAALGGPAATSIQMLIAIAAADPENRRRSVVDAEKGLSALERLHAERRLGRLSRHTLREISAWSTTSPVPGDEAAARLFREVELRVLVELAKGERDD